MSETNFDNLSLLEKFSFGEQTLAQAEAKYALESSKKYADKFQTKDDGTYRVRVLPLAPIMKDGRPEEGQRTGYEYPVEMQFLKIAVIDNKTKKPSEITYPVVNVKQAFPSLKEDLLDLYLRVASDKYADNTEFTDKIGKSNFEGGIRYDRSRAMYVLDMKKNKVLQYQASYPQYRSIEDAKLSVWHKLQDKSKTPVPCPLTSPSQGYVLEITKKSEGQGKKKKATYKFELDVLGGVEPLEESVLQALWDMPRLPEALYGYQRRTLEATIEFLKQLEEEWNVSVLDEPEVQDCIKAIEAVLPAEDNSHFNANGGDKEEEGSKGGRAKGDTIDDIIDAYEDFYDLNKPDRSPEGSELKTRILEFIDRNKLDIRVDRKTTLESLVTRLEEIYYPDKKEDDEPQDDPEPEPEPQPEPEPEEEPEEEESEPEEEEQDDPEPEPAPERPARVSRRSRDERNDDTNEPAAQLIESSRPRRERHSSRR